MANAGLIHPELLTNSCIPSTCALNTSFYNYRIDLAANIALSVCFSILLIIYTSIWVTMGRCHAFGFTMTLGLCTEIVGYAGRIWSYNNQWKLTPYFIQLCCITLAPASFSAGVYLCIGWLVLIYGRDNSRVRPHVYALLFMPCDTIALVLQLAGGLVADTALSDGQVSGINQGVAIFTAGLSWQVFTLLVFLIIGLDLALRIQRRRRELGDETALSQDARHIAIRASRYFHAFPYAVGLAAVLIFWRCIYRLVELNAGFNGPVTYDQGLFIAFEGVLIVVAVATLAVFHPSLCMGQGVTMELPR